MASLGCLWNHREQPRDLHELSRGHPGAEGWERGQNYASHGGEPLTEALRARLPPREDSQSGPSDTQTAHSNREGPSHGGLLALARLCGLKQEEPERESWGSSPEQPPAEPLLSHPSCLRCVFAKPTVCLGQLGQSQKGARTQGIFSPAVAFFPQASASHSSFV